jgi:hypothetical protein
MNTVEVFPQVAQGRDGSLGRDRDTELDSGTGLPTLASEEAAAGDLAAAAAAWLCVTTLGQHEIRIF